VNYEADEMMSVTAARALKDVNACFVGIGLPSTGANLARRTHAPDLVLVYEAGAIGAKPPRLPLSIGDGMLGETADAIVGVPEMFNYWVQSGRIDIGFLGAAQIDRFANINTTVIGGDYDNPKVRLPGAGGAPEIAASCGEVIVIVRQSTRAFVEKVDFVTSVGHGSGHRVLVRQHDPGLGLEQPQRRQRLHVLGVGHRDQRLVAGRGRLDPRQRHRHLGPPEALDQEGGVRGHRLSRSSPAGGEPRAARPDDSFFSRATDFCSSLGNEDPRDERLALLKGDMNEIGRG